MDKNLNISVLVAARDEYIEQLKSIIAPLIIQGVNSIYQDALNVSNGKKTLMTFQQFLKDIQTWNQTILQEEAKRIKRKCPYIMDIVTAIFVSNVKILASIRLKGNNDNIKIKIPTCELFVHSVYIESAQQIFYDPMLFYHKNGNFNQIQKNKKYIREIIYDAVEESMRKMMPFDHILQEYLKNALDDNAEYTDSESEDESEPDTNVLNNDKIINNENENENETENENENENTTKNLHIDGLNSYLKDQQNTVPQQTSFANFPITPPVPVNYTRSNPGSGSDSGSDYDSDSSTSSGSSFSSYSSDSSKSRRSEHREHREHHEHREHRENRENREHREHRGEKIHEKGEHQHHGENRQENGKYSFF